MADSKENPQQSIGEQKTPAPGSWLEKMERMGQEQAAQRTEPQLNQGKILTLEERLEKMRQQRESEGQKNKPSDENKTKPSDWDAWHLAAPIRRITPDPMPKKSPEEERVLELQRQFEGIEAFHRYRHAPNRGYPEGDQDPRLTPEDRLKRLENMKQEQATQRTEPQLNQDTPRTLEDRLAEMKKQREPERSKGRSRDYDDGLSL